MKRNLIVWLLYTSSVFAAILISCPSAFAVSYTRISVNGTASASSYYGSYVPSRAFDYNSNTQWISNGNAPQWLQYALPSARAVSCYQIYPQSSAWYAPKSWYFQGYNGSSWVTLDTRSGYTSWTGGTAQTFYISNTTPYQYYRLYITATNPQWYGCSYLYYCAVSDLVLWTHSVPLFGPFYASTSPVNIGDQSTLSWTTSYAISASINQGIGSVAVNGSRTVNPRVPTTYTLTAVGVGGSDYRTATILIYAPTVSMSANTSVIVSGDPLTLYWGATNVTSVTIDNGVGTVYSNSSGIKTINGTKTIYPTASTITTETYTITATGPGGTATKSVNVTVYPNTTDCDSDGLPDWYEVYTYGNLTSHGISNGNCDCD